MLSLNLLNDYFNGKYDQNAPIHTFCPTKDKPECPGTCSQISPTGEDIYFCSEICLAILKLSNLQKGNQQKGAER